MCGIYGLIRRDGGIDAVQLASQRDLLTHRGPNDAGIRVSLDGRIGLAHRRLSILDLTAAGHQPMSSRDGRFTIVFNGEIYNHHEIRAELERIGHAFYTGTDTEVLLSAYIVWGEKCLARLNGMFAFALHDAGNAGTPPSLFLARDRAGKKPLYYAFDGRQLEFASQLKAISQHGGLSLDALNYYLALGYVPHDLCIVDGVKKLPPAHAARLDLSTFEFKVWRYWSLPANRPDPGVDGESLADAAGKLIEDATRLRLEADVPVGVLLSGGWIPVWWWLLQRTCRLHRCVRLPSPCQVLRSMNPFTPGRWRVILAPSITSLRSRAQGWRRWMTSHHLLMSQLPTPR